MTRNRHDLVEDHFGVLDDAQIASGTPADQDVPISNGDGTRTWGPMTGGGGGSGEWDFITQKANTDQVINSTTMAADSELVFAVLAAEVWDIRYVIMYTSNDATADYKWDLHATSGNIFGFHRYTAAFGTSGAIAASTGVQDDTVTTTTAVALGGTTGGPIRTMIIEAVLRFGSDCNLEYRFAGNATGGTAQTIQGSLLMARKLR